MAEKNFFHTAGVTTEQVITTKRSRLFALIPDIASTAGIITLRNAPAAEKVGTPGTVAGTPGAAGLLDDDTYYVKIVAVDQHGELSAGSTEQADTTVAGAAAGSVAYTWVAGTGATPTSYRVYVGLATGTFDGYYDVGAVLAFTLTHLTATPGYTYTAITPADTAAATSGTTKTVSASAAALLAAGKHYHGAVCDRGLVIQLANSADLATVIYEHY